LIQENQNIDQQHKECNLRQKWQHTRSKMFQLGKEYRLFLKVRRYQAGKGCSSHFGIRRTLVQHTDMVTQEVHRDDVFAPFGDEEIPLVVDPEGFNSTIFSFYLPVCWV